MIIGRRVLEKVINNLWKEGIIFKLFEINEFVCVKNINEIGFGDCIVIFIWKNEEVLGFIWVVEIEKVLGDEEVELLKKVVNVLKNKLL